MKYTERHIPFILVTFKKGSREFKLNMSQKFKMTLVNGESRKYEFDIPIMDKDFISLFARRTELIKKVKIVHYVNNIDTGKEEEFVDILEYPKSSITQELDCQSNPSSFHIIFES